MATISGVVQFQYSYASLDAPAYDSAGYAVNGSETQLADTNGESGSESFSVTAGQSYGWWVNTVDNTGEPGILTVSFSAAPVGVPEPGTFLLTFSALGVAVAITRRRLFARVRVYLFSALCLLIGGSLFAQTQNHYLASNATGQLTLANTVNVQELAATSATTLRMLGADAPLAASSSQMRMLARVPANGLGGRNAAMAERLPASRSSLMARFMRLRNQSLPVAGSGTFGFDGMTQMDQRLANNGNQSSVEPPSPSIAATSAYILEGVNNAIRVYSTDGTPLTPAIATDQLFGVAPVIDRSTGVAGVNPTDMRVYYDQDIDRWFILQRTQNVDVYGNPLSQSALYMAVSQTGDPTGSYGIYVLDSTDTGNASCPCFLDYPQIGSDRYGFYISANEYTLASMQFNGAKIFSIAKAALATGAATPATYRFDIADGTGYDFAIQPATTPPAASPFLANGGLEYFVSSQSLGSDSNLAIWALPNTATLQNPNGASLLLTRTAVPTLTYAPPQPVVQRPGPFPYGQSLYEPLAFIDGGPDSRVQSVVYSGGRLFVTLPSEVADENLNAVLAGAYVVLSPTFRTSTLAASVVKQGYIVVNSNGVLRPSISVDAQSSGAIAFTLAGPDYYPSAAFVTFDMTSATPSQVNVAGPGVGPEDGFTGYPGGFYPGVARWGDYSTAVTSPDGKIWMVTEYIPNLPHTQVANWGTYIYNYVP